MRRAVALVAAAVVLAVAAVVLLVAGVEVRETTGGLLVTPIRQVHLVGGYLVAGTVAGVAAVLTALVAAPAVGTARRSAGDEPDEPPTGSTGATPADDPAGEPDPGHRLAHPGVRPQSVIDRSP